MDPRPRRHRTTIAALLLLSFAAALSAQSEAPDAVAKRAAEATARADWKAFAELMHPAALADFRRMFREIVALEVKDRLAFPRRVDDRMRQVAALRLEGVLCGAKEHVIGAADGTVTLDARELRRLACVLVGFDRVEESARDDALVLLERELTDARVTHERVAALPANRFLLRDGVPVAVLASGEVKFLVQLPLPEEWAVKNALLRRSGGTVAAQGR